VIDAVAPQRPAANSRERDAITVVARLAEPLPQNAGSLSPERHDPLLTPLAPEFNVGSGDKVEPHLLKRNDLRHARASIVQGQQECVIAPP
jgi:hypothetical protein